MLTFAKIERKIRGLTTKTRAVPIEKPNFRRGDRVRDGARIFTRLSRRDVLDFAHPENLSEASGACRCKVKLNRRSWISASSCYTSRGSLSLLLPAHAEVSTASRRANKNAKLLLPLPRRFVDFASRLQAASSSFFLLTIFTAPFPLRKTPSRRNNWKFGWNFVLCAKMAPSIIDSANNYIYLYLYIIIYFSIVVQMIF